MAFPQDSLPIKQELLINGVWTDITTRTRGDAGVQITRGYSAEQAALSAASCTFTLNNRDGLFSNRNPTSAYYRQLGRNVQYRTSVQETTSFLSLRDYSATSTGAYDGAEISTTDKGVLDVIGDIDIRIDVEPDNWRTGINQVLASKLFTAGSPPQQSWFLALLKSGKVYFLWTADGSTYRAAQSPVSAGSSGRLALRVTLDVDNGGGGCTATFYTAPTITGTWTALGTPQNFGGTTSIYSSSSPIEIGDFNNATGRGSTFANYNPFVGRIYSFELRNGIAGTLVAKMDATAQAPGTTSWSDGLATPNTWTVSASAAITASDYRFWGEVSKLPQRWDSSGKDVYAPVLAGDLIQRLSQGQKTLESPIFRNLSQYAADGYFPLEEGPTTPTVVSAYVGRGGAIIQGNFNADPTLPGSAGALTFADDTGYMSGAAIPGPPTGTAYCLLYFRMPSVPLADSTIASFYFTGGTAYRLNIIVGTATYTFNWIDNNGSVIANNAINFGAGAGPNQWIAMRVRAVQSGGNINYDYGWYPVGAPVFYGSAGSFVGTIGRAKNFISYAYTGKTGLSLAHVLMARSDVGFTDYSFYGSTNGYRGETAGNRAARLSREQAVPLWLVGNSNDTFNEPMGAQSTSTYLDLMKECADLSGGLLYSPRDKFGLALRLPTAIRNQGNVSLSYTSKHFSGTMEPDEDDALIRNDVTVTRPNGGFGRKVKTTGTLNTAEPTTGPDAVGLYDSTIALNANTDDRLIPLAEREVFFGTWDELRYKKVQVNLERAPFVASSTLTRSVRGLDIGDPFTITGLPAWLPPDDVELLIIGYTEQLMNRGQEIIWNTAPYGPYRALNDLSGTTLARGRVAASNSTTSGTLNTAAVSMLVATPTGKLWGSTIKKPGNFPYNITVAGEVMTVTAIVGTTSPQTFTVTRSINGVVKTHASGETVQVVDRFYAAI